MLVQWYYCTAKPCRVPSDLYRIRIRISCLWASVAEPEPVEPKLFYRSGAEIYPLKNIYCIK